MTENEIRRLQYTYVTNNITPVLYTGVTSDLKEENISTSRTKNSITALQQSIIATSWCTMKTLIELKKRLQERNKLKAEAEKQKKN